MVDIAAGITMAVHAVTLAREIQGFEASVDRAELKLKAADLMLALADVKTVLAEAQNEITDLKQRIAELTEGEPCPLCDGYLKVTATRPHPLAGEVGIQERTVSCQTCSHSELRMFDPNTR